MGKDVVQLLQEALDRRHIHVKCSALVNDTCGTLMARAYEAGSCLCGGIFGTGTNGAYVEKIENITKMKDSESAKHSKENGLECMVINTECEFLLSSSRVGCFADLCVLFSFSFFLGGR